MIQERRRWSVKKHFWVTENCQFLMIFHKKFSLKMSQQKMMNKLFDALSCGSKNHILSHLFSAKNVRILHLHFCITIFFHILHTKLTFVFLVRIYHFTEPRRAAERRRQVHATRRPPNVFKMIPILSLSFLSHN